MCDVSIILLNYKNPQLTVNCVKSIIQSKPKVTYEIIVIDNHSEDGSLEFLEDALPSVVIKDSGKNGGFAYGNNMGVKLSSGKYLLLLNNDTEIKEGMIDDLYECVKGNSHIGMVGCRSVNGDGIELPVAHKYETLKRIMLQSYVKPVLEKIGLQRKLVAMAEQRHEDEGGFTRAEWISGAAMFLERRIYDEVGGLDENFFMYMEDEDLSHRINDAGYLVGVINKIGYTHFCGGSTIKSYFLTKEYIKSRMIYFRRYESKNFEKIQRALFSQIRVVNTSLSKSDRRKMITELRQFAQCDLQNKAENICRI